MRIFSSAAIVIAGLVLADCSPRPRNFGQPQGYTATSVSEDDVPEGAMAYGGRRGGQRTCPPGTTAMGAAGCAGETITSAEATQPHNVRFTGPCQQGKKRVLWKKGNDDNGKVVRWRIVQHQDCSQKQQQEQD